MLLPIIDQSPLKQNICNAKYTCTWIVCYHMECNKYQEVSNYQDGQINFVRRIEYWYCDTYIKDRGVTCIYFDILLPRRMYLCIVFMTCFGHVIRQFWCLHFLKICRDFFSIFWAIYVVFRASRPSQGHDAETDVERCPWVGSRNRDFEPW